MNIDDVLDWLQKADDDLDSAVLLNDAVRKHIEIICYHCAQAVEKYLKAFIVYNGIIPKKTHDLLYLRDLCEQFDNNFKELLAECTYLNKFSNDIRYPNKHQTNESDVKIAIKYTKKVSNFKSIVKLKQLQSSLN